MMSPNLNNKQHGFTVTEIMIVVTLLGILGAFAIPAFLAWFPGYQLKSAVRDLQGHLQTAKYEAVQRGGNVAVVFTTGVFNPAGRIGSYQIFSDTDGDFNLDAGEALIRQVNMPSNVSLTAAAPANLMFNARGLPNAAATVTLRNQTTWGQALITLVGRVNIQRSTDNGATDPYQQWD